MVKEINIVYIEDLTGIAFVFESKNDYNPLKKPEYMMQTLPIAKIIRIKNCHLKEISKAFDLQDALDVLQKKQFKQTDATGDGFIETFEGAGGGDHACNTLVFFNAKGYFVDVNYTA